MQDYYSKLTHKVGEFCILYGLVMLSTVIFS
jgi:hypothetical protein